MRTLYIAAFKVLTIVTIVGAGLYGVFSYVHIPSMSALTLGAFAEPFASGSLYFTGDVMLGRNVETLNNESGSDYSFTNVSEWLREPNIAIGNFEGPVPLVHVPTKPLTFQFSIDKKFMESAVNAGFDILSLANNHANDYGSDDFQNTQSVCTELGIQCLGQSTGIGTTSTAVVTVGDTRVGLFFIHTLFAEPDPFEMSKAMITLKENSDVQIVYIHWGVEYEPIHSTAQKNLAEYLIDWGADAIVGHHPHVVQDIELYSGKPIFYSLGNFIFDQYFSDEVQTGLGIEMQIDEDTITYTLVPFTSIGSRSQPRIMNLDEKLTFFSRYQGLDYIDMTNTAQPKIVVERN